MYLGDSRCFVLAFALAVLLLPCPILGGFARRLDLATARPSGSALDLTVCTQCVDAEASTADSESVPVVQLGCIDHEPKVVIDCPSCDEAWLKLPASSAGCGT